MIYADVNPLMKKAYEAQLEEGGGAEEVDENAPTLLSLTEQIELQNTVKDLMEEIKGLKKKVTEEQQKVLTAHAATKKETKKIKKHISKDAHIASTAEETPFP